MVAVSLAAALLSMALTRAPDPASLVAFYQRVRPVGWWAPVRALAAPGSAPGADSGRIVSGVASGLALVYGASFGVGHLLLGQHGAAAAGAVAAILGAFGVARSLRPLLRAPVSAVDPR